MGGLCGAKVTTLLLDADVLVYRLAYSEQVTTRWERDLWTQHALLEPALDKARGFIQKLMGDTGCTEVRCALSDLDRNFRREVMATYKQTRCGNIRPILFKPLREFFLTEHSATVIPGCEGDDVLAMWATELKYGEFVLASIDKDLRQLHCCYYNWDKEDGVEVIGPEAAESSFLTQVLTGDRVDNYPGCKGIGPVRAEAILNSVEDGEEPWDAIVRAYEKAGLSEAVALENARCARLLRHGDVREDGAIRLWHPRGEDVWLPMPRSKSQERRFEVQRRAKG